MGETLLIYPSDGKPKISLFHEANSFSGHFVSAVEMDANENLESSTKVEASLETNHEQRQLYQLIAVGDRGFVTSFRQGYE